MAEILPRLEDLAARQSPDDVIFRCELDLRTVVEAYLKAGKSREWIGENIGCSPEIVDAIVAGEIAVGPRRATGRFTGLEWPNGNLETQSIDVFGEN